MSKPQPSAPENRSHANHGTIRSNIRFQHHHSQDGVQESFGKGTEQAEECILVKATDPYKESKVASEKSEEAANAEPEGAVEVDR